MDNVNNEKRSEKNKGTKPNCFSSGDSLLINNLNQNGDENIVPEVGYPDSEGDEMMEDRNGSIANVSVGRSVSVGIISRFYDLKINVFQAQRRWSLNFSRNKKFIYQKTINFMPSRRLRSEFQIFFQKFHEIITILSFRIL